MRQVSIDDAAAMPMLVPRLRIRFSIAPAWAESSGGAALIAASLFGAMNSPMPAPNRPSSVRPTAKRIRCSGAMMETVTSTAMHSAMPHPAMRREPHRPASAPLNGATTPIATGMLASRTPATISGRW